MELFLGLLGTGAVGALGFIAVKLQNIEINLAVAVKQLEIQADDIATNSGRIKDLEIRMRDVEINL